MLIWLIPAALAALPFFKLGSLYVLVNVMSLLIRALVVCCLVLLLAAGGLLWRRRRTS